MTDYPESFSNFPETVTELKAKREERSDKWTPRDALIHMLRLIDDGIAKPTDLIVSYRTDAEGAPENSNRGGYYYIAACRHGLLSSLSLLETAKFAIMDPREQ